MQRQALCLILLLLWTCPSMAQTNFSVPYDFCPDQGPTNMISYELQQPGPVKLVVQHIFTNLHVRNLIDDVQAAGIHQVTFDGYDDSGQPLETGVYVFKLQGDGWEVEQWSVLDCGLDAAIQSRVTVGNRDVTMAFANILEEEESAELAVYTADGSIRVKDFSYLNQSHVAFWLWAFEDSTGQVLPAGDYLYRMASASHSEDIPFTIDPINRGSLTVTVTDADGTIAVGIDGTGDAPVVKGPLQQVEIDFGRFMSTSEIQYILDGGLEYSGALNWAQPISPVVRPDSTGIIFSDFDLARSWPDIWGDASVVGYGLFDPQASRFRLGFGHQGFTSTDHFCHTMGEIDEDDWVINPGPFFFTPSGTMMPPCQNPIPPGQYTEIQYSIDEDGPVMMQIIDSAGNAVRQLVNGSFSAGFYTVYWDRLDNFGIEVPEGLYHLIWDTSAGDGGQVITSGDIYVSNAPSPVLPVTIQSPLPTLSDNYPNPFNPTTVISFDLPAATFARITVLSLDGKKVKTLLAAQMPSGNHNATWSGRDHLDRSVPSGTYFYRLEAGGITETRRMLLLK